MTVILSFLGILAAGPAATPDRPTIVRVPFQNARELDIADLVERLGAATAVPVVRPSGSLSVPIVGVGGTLSRTALRDILGADTGLEVDGRSLVVTLAPDRLAASRRPDWEARLRRLADHVEGERRRNASYGFRALKSYRANDPRRPTVCLVHGLNSSSGGFIHLIPHLEAAGYGVVVHDFPFNRNLAESSAGFARDWAEFRRKAGETRPWAILAHSMGALIARAYVEDPVAYAGDVATLILIAPVNQGSSLAKAQTFLQLLHGVQAVQSKATTQALSHLGDGLGEAADDMTPGSRFLTALNRRPRRAGVRYHLIAGDAGFVSRESRRQVQDRIDAIRRSGGLLGGLARMAATDLEARLDEVSDGTGDGCVSVARTRLDGAPDPIRIHANHAELIRAPLLFRDPGPVVSMPWILKWLREGLPQPMGSGDRPR